MLSPMTHENRLVRVEGAEPTTRRFQLRNRDPTPMSTNETSSQRLAETKPNDKKWLNDSHVTEKIEEHLHKRATRLKSWFKARHVAEAIGEDSRVVGPAMAAMYRSENYPEVTERRSAGDALVYKVVLDN